MEIGARANLLVSIEEGVLLKRITGMHFSNREVMYVLNNTNTCRC